MAQSLGMEALRNQANLGPESASRPQHRLGWGLALSSSTDCAFLLVCPQGQPVGAGGSSGCSGGCRASRALSKGGRICVSPGETGGALGLSGHLGNAADWVHLGAGSHKSESRAENPENVDVLGRNEGRQ